MIIVFALALVCISTATIEKVFLKRNWNQGMAIWLMLALLGVVILQSGKLGGGVQVCFS